MTGQVTAISCSTLPYSTWSAGECVVQCYIQDECRVAFRNCTDSKCGCDLCQGVQAIDFTKDDTFFLNGLVLAQNVNVPPFTYWLLPGGLSIGQVIRVRVVLAAHQTRLALTHSNGDLALNMHIKFNPNSVTRHSRTNNVRSHSEEYVPFFNFTVEQDIEIVYLVEPDKFVVYFERAEFFSYEYRTTDLESIEKFSVNAAGGDSPTGTLSGSEAIVKYLFVS